MKAMFSMLVTVSVLSVWDVPAQACPVSEADIPQCAEQGSFYTFAQCQKPRMYEKTTLPDACIKVTSLFSSASLPCDLGNSLESAVSLAMRKGCMSGQNYIVSSITMKAILNLIADACNTQGPRFDETTEEVGFLDNAGHSSCKNLSKIN